MSANSAFKLSSPSIVLCKLQDSRLFGSNLKKKPFPYRTDSEEELNLLQSLCREEGAFDAVVCSHWATGSQGASALAEAVARAAEQPSNFRQPIFPPI